MGTSIAAGVGALSEECRGAFIVPTDMPNLTSALFARLRADFDAAMAAIGKSRRIHIDLESLQVDSYLTVISSLDA
jgi:CTP:molybdopterin cytidylyltransferase MocA